MTYEPPVDDANPLSAIRLRDEFPATFRAGQNTTGDTIEGMDALPQGNFAGLLNAPVFDGRTYSTRATGVWNCPFTAASVGVIGVTVVGWDIDGTPVGGTATGAATTDPTAWDYPIGTLMANPNGNGIENNHGDVWANRYPLGYDAISGLTAETVSDDLTVDVEDAGKLLVVDTTAKVITLPDCTTMPAGMELTVQAGASLILVTVTPTAGDKIYGADDAGVDDESILSTALVTAQGDYVVLRNDKVVGWQIIRKVGTWTKA